MKLSFVNVLLGTVISIVFSSGASANYSGMSYRDLLDQCGQSSDVGYASVFGEPSDYLQLYPKMGRLLAEVEAIPGIDAQKKSYAREVMADGKSKKDQVYELNANTNKMVGRNHGYISATEELLKDTMDKYGAQHNQLQKESNYVSDKAVEDVHKKLQETEHRYGSSGSHVYEKSDYMIWQQCVSWWADGMPYYQTTEEEDRNYHYNGWKNGEKTGSIYTDQSSSQTNSDVHTYEGSDSGNTELPYEFV